MKTSRDTSDPLVTLRDIARRAGVSYSTVSLCLSGNAKAAAETRQRVRALAAEMGYRPNPVLSALAHYRNGRRRIAAGRGTMVLLSWWDQRKPAPNVPDPAFWSGAVARASVLGYTLEGWRLPVDPEGQRRVERMLVHRGIAGCIVWALSINRETLHFSSNPPFPMVRIGESVTNALPTVGPDHAGNLLLAARALAERGVRRIGCAFEEVAAARLGYKPLAGLERARWEMAGRVEVVPHLRWERNDSPEALRTWFKRERPEALIGVGALLDEMGRLLGPKGPRLVASDLRGDCPHCGVIQGDARVGELAVGLLHQQVVLAPEDRADGKVHLSIRGVWRDALSPTGGCPPPPRGA